MSKKKTKTRKKITAHENIHSMAKLAHGILYDLDEKIGNEFNSQKCRLFTSATHGFILGETCEVKMLLMNIINESERLMDHDETLLVKKSS